MSRIAGMRAQLRRLQHLAELREDLARRGLAASAHALAEARQARAGAEAARQDLIEAQAARREALRSPLIGSTQLRGALAAVLTTFEADRMREAEAASRVATADQLVTGAEAALAQARAKLSAAGRLVEKRRRMIEPLSEALAKAAEARDEAEAAELPLPLAGAVGRRAG
ncbi:type III secretion system stalk subunit SctO [Paracoccus aminophilus]|uniref:Type III secretion protein n=1 Tax=Paracoccus aminophilus JCM 7686 TaxID=1367847 RepID=S5YBQ0_PARAH|nr:YscO family type III secretion system apparatus protein [Paracoccus aminophilus]AGT08878.1 type III secretion protein [Paracoccus aminophilus JCM 7686]